HRPFPVPYLERLVERLRVQEFPDLLAHAVCEEGRDGVAYLVVRARPRSAELEPVREALQPRGLAYREPFPPSVRQPYPVHVAREAREVPARERPGRPVEVKVAGDDALRSLLVARDVLRHARRHELRFGRYLQRELPKGLSSRDFRSGPLRKLEPAPVAHDYYPL